MARPDPLPIDTLDGPIDVVVALPGSKSITNRALVCAALARGTSILTNALHADDTEAMVEGLRALGAQIDADWGPRRIVVEGTAGNPVADVALVDARLSGTTSRFLLPVAGLGEGLRRVDAANRMRERPMGDVLDAVRTLGAAVHEVGAPGHLPVEVQGGSLAGGEVVVRGDVSSQYLSGLLLAGPAMPRGSGGAARGRPRLAALRDAHRGGDGALRRPRRSPGRPHLERAPAGLRRHQLRRRAGCLRRVLRLRRRRAAGRSGDGRRARRELAPG